MQKLWIIAAFMLAINHTNAQSDDCSSAVEITPTLTMCDFQAGSSYNATQSLPSCSGGGNADDDVWYFFTANSSVMTIEVDPTQSYDAVVQLFSGTCGSLVSIQCEDINGNNGDEVLVANGLTPGNTYYVRVYHYGIGSGSNTFNICVSGQAPVNNETPCDAYLLPEVDPSCVFLTYTNAGSAGSAVGTPSGCGGSSPFQGGYAGGDVWFKVVVPASGELDIHTLSMDFSDGAMALYSGSCSSLTLVECDDDGEPGDGILMPHIYHTGLTAGDTMWIRMWEYGNNNNGQFGICVSTPDNDECANAQEICDLNGYGGVTSSAYTIDNPDNMYGTSESASGVFGIGYTGVSPVTIDNNSWLTFTASSTTAELFVEIQNCANNNGLQMQIFEGTNCTNFSPVSNFLETTTSQTIIASGLTPGQKYYIVVDGFAGDICSYNISATSGVQVVEAIAANEQLCLGESTTIDAQVVGTGSYTYNWSSDPVGSYPNNAQISVSPIQTTEYTVEINGFCGTTTNASVLVTVNDLPTANAGSDETICDGETANLNATGGTSYNWDNGLGSGASQSVNPSSTTTYEVTATDNNGCTDTDQVTVNVNPLPNANAGSDEQICNGESVTISASGGTSYTWDNGLPSGSTHTVSPTNTTTYTVTAEDANGCTDTDDITVTVNPLPNVFAGNDVTICNGSSVTLSASGGTSYFWGQGLGAGQSHTVTPAGTTTYNVTATDANNCQSSDDITVTVGAALVPDAGQDVDICDGQSVTLSGSGGTTYEWEDPSGTTIASSQSTTITPTQSGYYNVLVTDGGSCSGEDSLYLNINTLPTANAGQNQTICLEDTITLSASGGSSYFWDNNLGSGSTQQVSPSSTTTYNVVVTDPNGCEDSDDVIITVNPLPTILASSDVEICEGESTNITANGANSYTWDQGLGSGASQTVSPSSTSTYTVTGTNSFNCSSADEVIVTVNDLPVIDTSSMVVEDADCINGGGTISGINIIGQPSYTYEWTDGLNVVSNTLSAGALSQGTYYLTVTDGNGCVQNASVFVDFQDLSTLNANNDSTSTLPNIPVDVAAFANDTGDVNTITVINGPYNGSGSFSPSGVYSYTPNTGFTGVDSVIYELCDPVCVNACERATIYITIDDRLPVDVPNGFSPNGDGFNDYFVIDNLEQYPENRIIIFNRWGDEVYKASPYQNDWDGSSTNAQLKLRGGKVVDGTYFFILDLGEGVEPINSYVELKTK